MSFVEKTPGKSGKAITFSTCRPLSQDIAVVLHLFMTPT
jgi:hypothetical protein